MKSPVRLLVIDDDPGIRDVITDGISIGDYDYEIKSAVDGKTGLSQIKEWKPDLIILDLHMPNGDGFEVAEAVRKDAEASKIKIIMLTANPSKKNQYEGLDLGVDVFMAKPFDFDELEANIRALLNL